MASPPSDEYTDREAVVEHEQELETNRYIDRHLVSGVHHESTKTNFYWIGSERSTKLALNWTKSQSAGRNLLVSQTR